MAFRALRALSASALGLAACLPSAEARTLTASTVEEVRTKTAALVAGDTLVVAAGTYDMTSWNISGLKGTESKWIVIRAGGKAVVRSASNCCNLVQMSDLEYVAFQGFELTMRDANPGIDGVNLRGGFNRHVRLEKLHIHHMTGNGVSVFADSSAFITLTGSEISHTEGSGLYWGYPGKWVVRDALIQGNYIHHCPANPAQANHYGIQFKGWSYRSRILDNVLHDVGGTTRSGLIVYYGRKPLLGDAPEDRNVVAGNALWRCRNEGITVMSDALIENNLVMDAGTGINIQSYSDESFTGSSAAENLQVRHNTVFRCARACISVSGWAAAGADVSLTGNAAYQADAGASAISGSLGTGKARFNVAFGRSTLAGTLAGKGPADFLGVPAADFSGVADLYPAPGSPVLDVVEEGAAAADFNGTARPAGSRADAGAYERTGAVNPGWLPVTGFKGGTSAIRAKPIRSGSLPSVPRLHAPGTFAGIAHAWTVGGFLPARDGASAVAGCDGRRIGFLR